MCVAFLKHVNNTFVVFINLRVGKAKEVDVGVLPERLAGRLPEVSQGDSDFGELTGAHLPLRKLQRLTHANQTHK